MISFVQIAGFSCFTIIITIWHEFQINHKKKTPKRVLDRTPSIRFRSGSSPITKQGWLFKQVRIVHYLYELYAIINTQH